MKSTKLQGKLLIACIALISSAALLKAGYYKPDFFPIGLTGLNYTGADPMGKNCPYANAEVDPPWGWTPQDNPDNNEKALIEALGVNCLGSSDSYHYYLLNFDESSSNFENNYLHKICKDKIDDGNDTNDIYLIPLTYAVLGTYQVLKYATCCIEDDSVIIDTHGSSNTYSQHRANSWFRSPHRANQAGYGDPLLTDYDNIYCDPPYDTCTKGWGCHGIDVDNWDTYDGNEYWREMMDSAIVAFDTYFNQTLDADELACIWGWNLITEDPAVVRNYHEMNNEWRGCWAAVDYVFTGHKNTSKFKSMGGMHIPDHEGFRGAEESGTNRMIVAKSGIASLVRADYNIFDALPDLDVIVPYWEPWCRGNYNYGEQGLFDDYLYRNSNYKYVNNEGGEEWKKGYHHVAIYFQKYGDTPGGPAGQKRRWVASPGLQWRVYKNNYEGLDSTRAIVRRPCPPEIRCATYLAFSRGAKGILYHGWSFPRTTKYKVVSDSSDTTVDVRYPMVKIPDQTFSGSYYNIGIRDKLGYPFGDEGSGHSQYHVLNDGAPSPEDLTYWHTNNVDSTYAYLKTLIKEIKAIDDILIDLDWVNAYSLMSTDPNWTNPCPHYYMEDVWGADYMDVAFFDHPYEPVGVEYFMMVNREGIPDMTNRSVGVALDAGHWPESDTLILTDMANRDNPRTLIREGNRYIFTEEFEPGEGKLYRAAPTNPAPVANLTSKGGK